MPGYKYLVTKYFKAPATMLLRLNSQDTRFLLQRIQEAVEKNSGVNLIYVGHRGGISITESPEKGQELKFIVYGQNRPVHSEMEGYDGPWSHCEIAVERSAGMHGLEEFTKAALKIT
jgi:hypothetical protein